MGLDRDARAHDGARAALQCVCVRLARTRGGMQKRANGIHGFAAACKGSRSLVRRARQRKGWQGLARARKGARRAQENR
eukprot:10143472-Alexandrium_andersonii.AAC.1